MSINNRLIREHYLGRVVAHVLLSAKHQKLAYELRNTPCFPGTGLGSRDGLGSSPSFLLENHRVLATFSQLAPNADWEFSWRFVCQISVGGRGNPRLFRQLQTTTPNQKPARIDRN